MRELQTAASDIRMVGREQFDRCVVIHGGAGLRHGGARDHHLASQDQRARTFARRREAAFDDELIEANLQFDRSTIQRPMLRRCWSATPAEASRSPARWRHSFAIPVTGRECLDIGASTGGFTDVLLKRGAARVVALDVGHGQFDWTLRNDPRVVVIERFNARHLTPADLPGAVNLVVIDVSFISLRQIFPVLPAVLLRPADVVALVKPQFEAGREEVGKGVIHDAAIHERVLEEVSAAAAAIGLNPAGSTPSPITGQKGNVEFLLHLRAP